MEVIMEWLYLLIAGILEVTWAVFAKSKGTVRITKASTISKKITKLKAKRTYYVRIRAYKTYKGTKYYSKWSKASKVTTK